MIRSGIETNFAEKAQSLQSLVAFLESTSAKIHRQVETDLSAGGHPRAAAAALRRSQSLSDRVKQLTSNINEILGEGRKLTRGNSIQRFLRSSEDASTLKSLNDQVLEAKSRFQLQGTVSIELVVNEIIKTAQMAELERDLSSIHTVDAGYRASVNGRKSKWLEGTRIELLKDIEDWSTGDGTDDARAAARIFVLVGAAGTGKSTIAVQVARTLDKAGVLGGSFFFERGVEELSATRYVFPTLAVQLARSHQTLAPFIAEGISKHRRNGKTQHLSYALDELIMEPLRLVPEDHWPSRPIVFVLDALDECSEQSQIPEMLYLLLKHMRSLPFPLRLFLTTRPDYQVQDAFASSEWQSEPDPFQLHSVPAGIVRDDISRFIEHQLSKLGIIDAIKAIQGDAIDRLTDAADGLFIYASTCLEFLHQYKRDLRRSLELVLDHPLNVNTLDILYDIVLRNAFSENILRHPDLGPLIPAVLGALAVLQDQLVPASLCDLLMLRSSSLDEILERLQSVLTFGINQPIRLLHASFPQYLADPSRCHDIPKISDHPSFRGHDHLAMKCLKALLHNSNLTRNICNLKDPLVPRNEIPELNERLTASLLPHVRYACLYWSVHLGYSNPSSETTELLRDFAETKMLNWMEALGRIEVVATSFNRVLKWYKEGDRTTTLLHHGLRFILSYISCIQTCPFQVYMSALSFTPSKCLLREAYPRQEDHFPSIDVLEGLDETWGPCLRVMEGHHGRIKSIALSHDGLWIASASSSNIDIWDIESGSLLRTLSNDEYWVMGSALSLDNRIITGDWVGIITIWNATTGAPLKVIHLEADRPKIKEIGLCRASNALDVAQRIAVLYYPDDLQVLDIDGRVLHQWNHRIPVSSDISLDWSVDARYLAVSDPCSQDNKIIIYDATSSSFWKELVGHEGDVQTLRIIPEPRLDLLVSGGKDCTVRLWKMEAQECLHVFRGHTSNVWTVTVDPSSTIVASGSWDSTIRLWSIQDKTCVALFSDVEFAITALDFTQDGKTLASGDDTGMLSLWDVDLGLVLPQKFVPDVDCGPVCRISPDCQFAATQSQKGDPIGIWRLQDDHFLSTIESASYSDASFSIVNSSDGRCIAIMWSPPLRASNINVIPVHEMTEETYSLIPDDVQASLGYAYSLTMHLVGVSLDGRHIWMQSASGNETGWEILDRQTNDVIRVGANEAPPVDVKGPKPQLRYALARSSGWLVDQWTDRRIAAWIPSGYRCQQIRIIRHDDLVATLLSVNRHRITVLRLKTNKGGSGGEEDSDLRWQNAYRCIGRALPHLQ
ncbi:hypothetical protein ONZ45_g828 [Pleurotus djamor]|nr:hypothetical protein ONZ45_g828 [Pleurotus djamor]